jgi:hypothetical protein
MEKRFWHLLDEYEYASLMSKEPSIQEILDGFKQPDWCTMNEALDPVFGCDKLLDKEIRMDISPRNVCKECPYCRRPRLFGL